MNAPAPAEVLTGEHVPAAAAASPIVEFSPTAAALADLAQRYAARVYDVTTAAGMYAAKAGRRELREIRVAIEGKRVELKAPLLERERLLDSEAKRITAALVALEDPIDAQIKAEEERKERERAERERQAMARAEEIGKRIGWLRSRMLEAAGRPAAQVDAIVHALEKAPVTDELYGERLAEAQAVVADTLAKLRELAGRLHSQEAEAASIAEARRKLEADQAAERARVAAEERQRREQQEREDRERADRIAAEDAERARVQAEEDAKRAAARKAEDDRLAAEQAERDRQAEAARAQQEEQDRIAREAREREEAAAAEERRRVRAAIEERAQPWVAIERALALMDDPGGFDVSDLHAILADAVAARGALALLDKPAEAQQ